MNGQKNEIMALAKKAGLLDKVNSWDVWFPDNLEAFAKLVAAKERERIALMIEDAPPLVDFCKNDRRGCLICGFTPSLAAQTIRELK